jgi:hypothetical protein
VIALAWPVVALAVAALAFVAVTRFAPPARMSRRLDAIETASGELNRKMVALASATDAELTKFRNTLTKFDNRTGGDAADRLLAQKAKAEAPKGPNR